jgi:hypothetical protein
MWMSYTIGASGANLTDVNTGNKRTLSTWAFVFGPSITVGSIGALL